MKKKKNRVFLPLKHLFWNSRSHIKLIKYKRTLASELVILVQKRYETQQGKVDLLVFANNSAVHSRKVSWGGFVAVAVGVSNL